MKPTHIIPLEEPYLLKVHREDEESIRLELLEEGEEGGEQQVSMEKTVPYGFEGLDKLVNPHPNANAYKKLYDPVLQTLWNAREKDVYQDFDEGFKEFRDYFLREYSNEIATVFEQISEEVREQEEDVEQEQGKEELSEAVKEKARDMLSSENPLQRIKEEALDKVVAGEHENKKMVFTLLFSGKIDDPSMKQILIPTGEAGVGKSTLASLSKHFKRKKVGRFTEHALDYSDLEAYEILYLQELEKTDRPEGGVSTLKFTSSEDEGYTVEYTTRDPESGQMETETKEIPPITVISTTTRLDIEKQMDRRAWRFEPDDSVEQTRRILEEFKAKREKQKELKKLGVIEKTDVERGEALLEAIVQELKPVDVIVPYPKTLAEILPHDVIRVRGDYDKVMAYLRLYGMIQQKNLPKTHAKNGDTVHWLLPERALQALSVIKQPLQTMLSGLVERARALITHLQDLEITKKGDIIKKGTREELARIMDKSEDTVYRYLEAWATQGFFSTCTTDEKYKPKGYELLYDLETIKEKTMPTLGIEANPKELLTRMYKELAETFSNFLSDLGVVRGEGVCIKRDDQGDIYVEFKKPIEDLIHLKTSPPSTTPTPNERFDNGKETRRKETKEETIGIEGDPKDLESKGENRLPPDLEEVVPQWGPVDRKANWQFYRHQLRANKDKGNGHNYMSIEELREDLPREIKVMETIKAMQKDGVIERHGADRIRLSDRAFQDLERVFKEVKGT